MKVKERNPKEPKSLPPISEWGPEKYMIPLEINPNGGLQIFPEGSSLDVEDDEQGNFVGLGIYSPQSNTVWYWSDFELAKKIQIPKFCAHNGRTDLYKLQQWGFNVTEENLVWDTQLMAHILDSSISVGFGLKDLAKTQLDITYPSYDDIVGKHRNKTKTSPKCNKQQPDCCGRRTLDKQPLEIVSNYNAMDCVATYKLYEQQMKQITSASLDYFHSLEKKVSFIFDRMERRGISLDVPYLTNLMAELSSKKEGLEAQIKNELGNINLNSPKQLLEALHAKEIRPTLKGKASTDKRAMARLAETPIVAQLLGFSELETLLSSFIIPYLERQTDVVHPSFHQCGTRTGRPSCSNPNLLQIPRRTDNGRLVRSMFKAKEGYLFGDCDFGQIEPRILAHLSKDSSMCAMFNSGVDFHSYTSDSLRRDREKAKVLNLSVGYRATFKSVSQQLKCSDQTAQDEIDKWWGLFPELYDWQQKLIYESKRTGYCTTLMGRRIKIEGLNEYNKWKREAAERQLINNIAQASATEVMKKAMIEIDEAGINILVQVYDELLFEEKEEDIENAMQIVVNLMENCVKLDVPLTVDGGIGRTWTDAKA